MSKHINQHKAELAASRQRLDQVLDAVSVRDQWDTPVYPDGWTVKQVAIHVADADRGHNNQIKGIAEGREVIPADFDLERYNRRSVEKRAQMTVEEIRQSLNTTRAELIAWLDTQDDPVLETHGRHASMRVMSIGEILHHLANHERTHADDIARAIGFEE